MGGALQLLPLYAFMVWTRKNLPFIIVEEDAVLVCMQDNASGL